MTPKERAAMQQALEALERWRDWDDWNNTAAWGLDDENTITALREALDHSCEANEMVAMNLNCKSVQARLATLWGYVKAEQAEQEPVAWCYKCLETGKLFDFMTEPDEYDLDSDNIVQLYAAPVRTKDLTDDEIDDVRDKTWCFSNSLREFARAVIAADREKNK